MNRWMLREATYQQLVHNHKNQHKGTVAEVDYYPVCRLYIPGTDIVWLLTELDPEDEIAFGLCQIQMAELGSVSMLELDDLDVHGLKVIEDIDFKPKMRLSGYAKKSRENGWIIAE